MSENDTTKTITSSELKYAGEIGNRFRLWIEGYQPSNRGVDIFVEEGADCNLITQFPVLQENVVFVHQSDMNKLPKVQAKVVPYSGHLDHTGSEIVFSPEVMIETESYATAPYVSIVYPTALSIADEVDANAVEVDMEIAREKGEFPDLLTFPLVTVVDERFWMEPLLPADNNNRRIIIRKDSGADDGPICMPWYRSLKHSDITPMDKSKSLGIARFLAAGKFLRSLRPRFDGDIRVLGFGINSTEDDYLRNDPVFAAKIDEEYYIADISTSSLFRVSETIAFTIERLFVSNPSSITTDDRRILEKMGLQNTFDESQSRKI